MNTTSRITSGELLKRQNGLGGLALDRRGIAAGSQLACYPATFV